MTTTLLQALNSYKGVLITTLLLSAAVIWVLAIQQSQLTSSSVSLGPTSQVWNMLEAQTLLSGSNSFSSGDSDARARALWADPKVASSMDVVAARYAWTWKTHSLLAVEAFSNHVRTARICLDGPGTGPNRRCLGTALVTTATTMPACLIGHINVRATYLYGGLAISIVEISQALYNARTKSLFCASGAPADVALFGLSHWVRSVAPQISHIAVFVRCPARDFSDPNSFGLLFVNHHGNCSLTAETMSTSYSNPKLTNMVLLTTPVTKSFQQEFPSLPVRGDALLRLPNVKPVPGAPFQFSTCAMAGVVDTDAPFLTAWLWHLRNKVLVDHVVLYTAPENFFLDSPNINASLMKEYLESGFVTLIPWPSRYIDGQQVFYRSQHTAYNDYLYRFRGLCHWTFFGDADDFFVSWRHDHQVVPVIAETLQQNADYDSITFPWPVFLPECQNVTGLGPPFDSDFILQQIQYGILPSPNTKHVTTTYEKQEAGIHKSPTRREAGPLKRAGVAIYHVRAGNFLKRGIADFSETTCAKYYLKDFDLEARKKHVYV